MSNFGENMSIEGLTFLVGLMIVGYGCYMACLNRFITGLSDRVTRLEEQLKKREKSSIAPNDSNRINYGDSIYSQATHDWLDGLDKHGPSDEQIAKAISDYLEDSKDTHK